MGVLLASEPRFNILDAQRVRVDRVESKSAKVNGLDTMIRGNNERTREPYEVSASLVTAEYAPRCRGLSVMF